MSKVILQEFETEFFGCPIGVKQGDCLSPTLFCIFINDLAEDLKASNLGVEIDQGILINVLLYADDIVLIAKDEEDLQDLLMIVEGCCNLWRLEVNLTKTNILHVRSSRKQQSKFMFLFNKNPVPYCKEYKYLGCIIHEHLNFLKTVNTLSESAGRSLSSIITKMIKNGGFPFKVFLTLFESCVCSVSDYGGEVFGYERFDSSFKLHARAARAFLGVSKFTPICGIISEFNQLLPQFRCQIKMLRYYHRLLSLDNKVIAKLLL